MTTDRYSGILSGMAGPADDAFTVTPSDQSPFAVAARALYIGAPGNVTLITHSGASILFQSLTAGTILPVRCVQVMATGTTASGIVGIV